MAGPNNLATWSMQTHKLINTKFLIFLFFSKKGEKKKKKKKYYRSKRLVLFLGSSSRNKECVFLLIGGSFELWGKPKSSNQTSHLSLQISERLTHPLLKIKIPTLLDWWITQQPNIELFDILQHKQSWNKERESWGQHTKAKTLKLGHYFGGFCFYLIACFACMLSFGKFEKFGLNFQVI